MSPLLIAERLGKVFPGRNRSAEPLVAIERIDLAVAEQEIVCIVGPSGCGKSTLLDIIAGFVGQTEGRLEVQGQPVRRPSPERGVVFQQAVLFPWLSVYDNVVLGPKARGADRHDLHREAVRVLGSVGLKDFQAHYPYQLSGGMRQRVQIARVLVASPAIILMDEPFGALDAQTRMMMHELLLAVWEEYKPTIIFITHDVEEALFLADRVIVMTHRPGRIKAEIRVPFQRPRRFDIMAQPEFGRLRAEVVASLRGEWEEHS